MIVSRWNINLGFWLIFSFLLIGCKKNDCDPNENRTQSVSSGAHQWLRLKTNGSTNPYYFFGYLVFESGPQSAQGVASISHCQAMYKITVHKKAVAPTPNTHIQIFTSRRCLAPHGDAELWVMLFVHSDGREKNPEFKKNGYLAMKVSSDDFNALKNARASHNQTQLKTQEKSLSLVLGQKIWNIEKAQLKKGQQQREEPNQNSTSESQQESSSATTAQSSPQLDFMELFQNHICGDALNQALHESGTQGAGGQLAEVLEKLTAHSSSMGLSCFSAADLTMFTAQSALSANEIARLNTAKYVRIKDRSSSAWSNFLTSERFNYDLKILQELQNSSDVPSLPSLNELAQKIAQNFKTLKIVPASSSGSHLVAHPTLWVASNNRFAEQGTVVGYDTLSLSQNPDSDQAGWYINQMGGGVSMAHQNKFYSLKSQSGSEATHSYLYKGSILVAQGVPVATLQSFYQDSQVNLLSYFVGHHSDDPYVQILVYPEVTQSQESSATAGAAAGPDPANPKASTRQTETTPASTQTEQPPSAPPSVPTDKVMTAMAEVLIDSMAPPVTTQLPDITGLISNPVAVPVDVTATAPDYYPSNPPAGSNSDGTSDPDMAINQDSGECQQ